MNFIFLYMYKKVVYTSKEKETERARNTRGYPSVIFKNLWRMYVYMIEYTVHTKKTTHTHRSMLVRLFMLFFFFSANKIYFSSWDCIGLCQHKPSWDRQRKSLEFIRIKRQRKQNSIFMKTNEPNEISINRCYFFLFRTLSLFFPPCWCIQSRCDFSCIQNRNGFFFLLFNSW